MSGDHYKPITMQEVRLCIGEGKLTAAQMLGACNAVMRTRKGHQLVTEMDQFAEILRERKALRESVRKLVGSVEDAIWNLYDEPKTDKAREILIVASNDFKETTQWLDPG